MRQSTKQNETNAMEGDQDEAGRSLHSVGETRMVTRWGQGTRVEDRKREQAGPGQAEDTQEKKSTGDTTGHGVLDGQTLQWSEEVGRGEGWKRKTGKGGGEEITKNNVKLTILIMPSKCIEKQNKEI